MGKPYLNLDFKFHNFGPWDKEDMTILSLGFSLVEHKPVYLSFSLKAHWQISEKWWFEKYCSCDKAWQFSAL